MTEKDIELTSIKVGILGDGRVGKSAICNSFTGIQFSEETSITIGSAKFEKKLNVAEGKEIKLVIWDTAGQERFRSAAFKTIRAVQGIALVFAINDRKSFENVETWLSEIHENMDNPCLVLLGNKSDLEKYRKVTEEEIKQFCKKKNMAYFSTSAKNNTGITEAFTHISSLIYKRIEEKKQTNNNNNIVIGKKNAKKKKKCC